MTVSSAFVAIVEVTSRRFSTYFKEKLLPLALNRYEQSFVGNQNHAADRRVSIDRRWNLNEREGRYAATNILEPAINLDFGLKSVDGKISKVGRYRLDLEALALQGAVKKREVSGNRVFDVQIHRQERGRYGLGLREGHTVDLETFRIS
jgi:hypothetical protein